MAMGSWSLDLDFSLSAKEDLFRDDGNPRMLWALVYDTNDVLVYPPLPLLWGKPGKQKIEIGGTSILWDLGGSAAAPTIDDREYLSGANKLDNPVFALDPPDSYWRRVADNSLWTISPGQATNFGGLHADDVLEYDRKFSTRPGLTYRVAALVVSGTGGLRLRTIYDGTFNPPNLLTNGDFEDGPGVGWSAATTMEILGAGARSGLYAMWVNPITPAELVVNSTFEDGSGWSGGTYFEIVTDADNARTGSGVLRCNAIPYPNYILDPAFAEGGWSGFGPNIGDVEIVTDGGEALTGSTVVRAGPVTQHQLFANSDMESTHYVGMPRAPGASPLPTGGVRGIRGAIPTTSRELSPPEHPGPPTLSATLASYGIEPVEHPDPVVQFLGRHGYLPADADPDAEGMEAAVEDFQRFVGLEPTGVVDEATVEMMSRPRCGVPDRVGPNSASWTYIGTRWEGVSVLKWYLASPGPFTQSETAGVIVDALSQWEACDIPLTFEETSVQSEAHIVIFWNDSPGDALAYAWQPPGEGEPLLGTNNGDVTFDDTDSWSLTDPPPGGSYSLLAGALHELGHAIGLNHSDVETAVMWPYLVGNIVLDADDITGIEAVYAGSPPSPPGPGGTVIPYWFQSNDIDTPSEDYYLDPGGGLDGSQAMTTEGDGLEPAEGVPEHKYVRADANADATGVEAFAVKPGEAYTFEAWVRLAPGTDGTVYVAAHIPHPTVANRERYWVSRELDAVKVSEEKPDEWQRLNVDVTVPANRYELNFILEAHHHHNGYIAWDNVTGTRTRGNRAQLNSDTHYRVIPGTEYMFYAIVRSGDDLQVGSIRVGVILTGPGVETKVIDTDKGFTDYVWSRAEVPFTPEAGYIYAQPFIAALDIVGEPVWVGYVQLYKRSNNTDQINGTTITVTPSQKYTLSADVRSSPDVYRGKVRIGVKLTGEGVAPLDIGVEQGITTPEIRSPDEWDSWLASQPNGTPYEEFETNSLADPNRGAEGYVQDFDGTWTTGATTPVPIEPNSKVGWVHVKTDVTPEPGYTELTPYVKSFDIDAGDSEEGCFWVDNVSLIKADNNSDSTIGDTFTVTPERTYRWLQAVRSGADLERGSVKLVARCIRPDHEDVTFDSSSMTATNGDWKFIDFSFTPPSGYEEVEPSIVATDVQGDVFQLDDGSIRDTDTKTMVFDTVFDGSGIASPFVDSTAPEGAESVRVALVAEEGSAGRSVLSVSLVRTDQPPSTGDDIIADLLVHPSTGLPVGIAAGTVDCPEVIPFDWRQIKMTLLAALAHYCDVISEPTREYRINPAIPPTIDVSTSPFVTRPIVLLPTDVDVEDVPDPTVDVTNRATEIDVIGAEVQRLNGQTTLITAKATVPGDVERDLNDNPIVRTKQISDGTIDTFGYANAYAADQALREASPGLVVDVTLTGTNYTRGALDVGDWLEIFVPESNIKDDDNPKSVEGVPCFPRVMRAVAREREHGPSFRVEMLRPDGTTFDLTYNESDKDSTKLTLADRRLYDWEADPQGGATGGQYLRDRASKPR